MRKLGAHMSIAGGVANAFERGESIGCTAIQIFVKNNNQWFGNPIPEEEVKRFQAEQKRTGIFVFAHAGYLINLAAPNPLNHKKSINSMLEELEKCEALNIPHLIIHPGSHVESGEEVGKKKIIASLKSLIKSTKGYKTRILLEITAGQGSSIGHTFEELAELLDGVSDTKRLGICFDTCHAFAAGYDIKTKEGYKKTWEDFDRTIGLKNLYAFHLNDSKKGIGSKVDRHENIGEGELGLEAFRLLLNDKRFAELPMTLETPTDPELKQAKKDLVSLRALVP